MSDEAPDTTEVSLNIDQTSTSPSQLEEVTLDYDGTFTNSLGAPSPCGGPMRGRSVKEFEDQLAGLKKENFNLKLRIYFLEERMGSNYDLDKEKIIKKNIELKVEVESLRKDLKEKHDLLCQADKALELQDDEYKKIIDKKDETIREYQKEIDELKTQISVLKQKNSAKLLQESTQKFEEKLNALKNELSHEKENNTGIRLVLHNKEAKIKNLTIELEDIRQKLKKRDNEFDELSRKFEDISDKNQSLLKKLQESKELFDNLKMENTALNKKQNSLQIDHEKLRKRYDSLKVLNDEKIAELQTRLDLSSNNLKKSQDLVVSSSRQELNPIVNNDYDSFLVSKSSTSPRYNATDPIPISPTKITFLSTTSSTSSTINSTPSSSPTSTPSLAQSVDTVIQQLKKEREHYHQKTIKLKAEQIKACHIIKKMIERQNDADKEICELKKKIKSLETELESIPTKSDQTSKQSMDGNTRELIDKYKSRINQLEDNYQALLLEMEEKNLELDDYRKQNEEMMQTIQDKEDRIGDLEFKILSNDDTIAEYEHKLNDKDIEIERLLNEISKKNINLQGIVNKELWDKNREIEKLQARHASKIIEQKDEKIQNLEYELTTKQQQLDLIKTNISELGIDINNDDNNYQLKNHLQVELEKSEQLRHEANEVCTILSRRLEELAIFLDSLLKQKTVLGFLGNKENRKLREIIDQSLDLTRSFSMSMLLNPDQSLTQLTNITNILNDTNVDNNVTLTYQSHLYNSKNGNNDNNEDNKDESQSNTQIIDALRQQIVTLKYELRLRDVELSKVNMNDDGKKCEKPINLNTTSTTLKYQSDIQSESESWSEPDRSVSRARIGLFNETLKSPITPSLRKSTNLLSSESEEVCHNNNNSRTPKKHENRQTILELNNQLYELEQKLNNKVDDFNELQQLFNIEQDKNRDLLQKIDDLTIKQQQYEEQINQLEIDREKALNVAREAEDVAEIAKNEMKSAEIKIQTLQTNTNNYQQQLENEYKKQLQEIEENAKIQIETLQTTLQQIRTDCIENCAKKYELDTAVNQLKTTQKLLEESQQQIVILTEKQQINENLLKESQDKINALRKDLDNSKLEYSEIVLEKTKLTNEKTCLEQELSNLTIKNSSICRQLEEIKKELEISHENHQSELLTIDEQKSRLELRISELESTNAQLQNRLIKIQTGYNNFNTNNEPILLSSSLPNYRRQLSDHSGYTSEEQLLIDNRNGVNNNNANKSSNRIEIERHEGNSSPDLGIESDHGRFSSLETHLNVPRPLLQTLELTESMNNLLDGDNSIQPNNCGDVRCCERTKRILYENNDLKRELCKTKRVLEDTVNKLALANQRKKQIEKNICRQIHKTSQVLKKAKANLDSGSETDLNKK